jgi:hypothetical protein
MLPEYLQLGDITCFVLGTPVTSEAQIHCNQWKRYINQQSIRHYSKEKHFSFAMSPTKECMLTLKLVKTVETRLV